MFISHHPPAHFSDDPDPPLMSLPGLTRNPPLFVGVYWIARSSRVMTAKRAST
jgi:hypothetical protein